VVTPLIASRDEILATAPRPERATFFQRQPIRYFFFAGTLAPFFRAPKLPAPNDWAIPVVEEGTFIWQAKQETLWNPSEGLP
jgi:hypothetical protein